MNFLHHCQFIDLTHPLLEQIPTWNGSCGFHLQCVHDYDETGAHDTAFRLQTIQMSAGIGTHMDAPAHCVANGITIGQMAVSECIVPAIVIDVSEHMDAHFVLNAKHIADFEAKHGVIAAHSLVIVNTGWSHFWTDQNRYRNVRNGKMQFPTISIEAALLLYKRDISGIAIDTLSPDLPGQCFPVHELMLGAGKYIIENVAHADLMPPIGGHVIALPLNMRYATESPIRMVGVIQN